MGNKSFTGRNRRRQTSAGVKIKDKLAKYTITVGGIGTIIAVCMVFIFLIYVAVPLFSSASLEEPREAPFQVGSVASPIHICMDDDQTMASALFKTGTIRTFRLDTGALLEERNLITAGELAAVSLHENVAALAFRNGDVQLVRIFFGMNYLSENDVPENLQKLKVGEQSYWKNGVLQRTIERQLKLTQLVVELLSTFDSEVSSPIRLIDHTESDDGKTVCLYTDTSALKIISITEQKNMLTGETVLESEVSSISVDLPDGTTFPTYLKMSDFGANVYLGWENGILYRYNTRDPGNIQLAQTLDVTPETDVTVTISEFLLGKSTLLIGDSQGQVGTWFLVKKGFEYSRDGEKLVQAHSIAGPKSPVTVIASSSRSRMFTAGYRNGAIRMIYVTSNKLLLNIEPNEGSSAVTAMTQAPKENGLLAVYDRTIRHWRFDPGYPEVTLTAIFMPVWYEGYSEAEHIWQSSSATDDFEPKFGVMPLVFGTFKATFYSMLFALPIALLAAIYTSEFMHAKMKARIKPTIELMASLPSVVLGFLAALVIAPYVEKVVPAMLAALFVVPFLFFLSGFIWQLAPYKLGLRLMRFRFVFLLLLFPTAILVSSWFGPFLEKTLFSGDIKAWLSGQIGNGMGGWLLLCTPLMGLLTFTFMSYIINPWLNRISIGWSRARFAQVDLSKFLLGTLLTVVLALGISWMFTSQGFDPRGSFIDTYIQRNAFIVGAVMGFAVIPIIYTIAEDALSAVPEHLRSASLGAGATPWQTAWRIVIPTATSGLFSAMMVGLGRAAGETMIVLMAAGNTPVMDWNIFNGFRTFSANIAVELPEAVRDSTHYRLLFLSALVLFVMTFIINAVAEIVRLRFRKRSSEL